MFYNGFGVGQYSTVNTIVPESGDMIDDVLDSESARKIYGMIDESKITLIDFGGGTMGITCAALVEACEGSHYKLQGMLKGVSRSFAKEVLEACKESLAEEPYQ